MSRPSNTIKKFLFSAVFTIAVLAGVFGFASNAFTDTYETSGTLVSQNLLSGQNVASIDAFGYDATIPAGTSLKVRFSRNGYWWYNSAGVANEYDTLLDGDHLAEIAAFDLSALNWAEPYFLYEISLETTSSSDSPVLNAINLFWTEGSASYTYETSATLNSINLLSGQTVTRISSFSYNASAIPAGTGITVQFSQDNSAWYNSAGVLDGSNTLSVGSNSIDLSALNWTTANFYYKMALTSDNSDTPVLDSVALNYAPPTDAYWVGGTGNWSDATNHWASTSGGTPDASNLPVATTNVYFDASSGGGTAIIDSAVEVANFTMDTGNTTSVTLGAVLTVSGNLTITTGTLTDAGFNLNVAGNFANSGTYTATGTITFVGDADSAADTYTIDTGGSNLYNLTMNLTDDVDTLQTTDSDPLMIAGNMTLTNGIFDNATNNNNLTVNGNIFFATVDTYSKGTGTITLGGTSGTQTINFLDKAVEDIVINSAGATKQFTDGVTTDSFNATAGTVDFNGQAITTTTDGGASGNFTIGTGAQVTGDGLGGSTLTVGGNLSLNGELGDLLDLTEDSTTWYLNTTGTAQADYVNVSYSNADGGTAITQTNSTDSNNNSNWLFNFAPNAPTLVSPANDSNTNDNTPTLSANYSDNDSADTGTTNYRISSSSLADCVNNINVVASGTSSATPDNNENTTYTPSSAIGSDATYYWCSQNNDGTETSSWTQMGSFTLDTAVPTTAATATRAANVITTSLSCADNEGGTGCAATYYCRDTSNTCTPTTAYTTPVTYQIYEPTYFRYYSIDSASNAGSIASTQSTMVGGQAVTTTTTYTPPPPAGEKPETAPNLIQQVAQQVTQQIQNIGEAISNLKLQISNSPQVVYPPIVESVPVKTPEALQNLKIMSVNPLGIFNLSQIESTVGFYANKLPQLKQTLDALAIDANKLSDTKKLSQTELYLPGLTQTVLTQAEIIKLNQVSNANQPPVAEITSQSQKKLSETESLQAKGLASVKGIPLAEMGAKALEKMPSNIVFARTSGGLIDFSSALNVDNKGIAKQTVRTISGKPVELIMKSDGPAKKVTGLITLKNLAKADTSSLRGGQQSDAAISQHWIASLLASLAPRNDTSVAKSAGLLVQKFEYAEVKPGVFKADFNAPTAEGEYQIATVAEYENASVVSTQTNLTLLVDPEGYVFRQTADGKLRIEKATVSIYWLNPEANPPSPKATAGKYELWPAEKFLQKNPIVTNDTGKYSFLVPQGKYYLTASAQNYQNFQSDIFEVKEDNGIRMDIELKKKTFFPDWLNWQAIIALLLFLVIVLIIVMFVYFVKKSKI